MVVGEGSAMCPVLLLLVVLLVAPSAFSAVEEGCLSCLCQAVTGCDANRACEDDVCGMFAMSRRFWSDAGAPGGDFETCSLDPACATQSVVAYMEKFARDCDGDGSVGCSDYGRLHHLGREGCGGILNQAFVSRLASCNASVPLGHFYSKSASRTARQGSPWRSGSGSSSPSVNIYPSVSYSSSVNVAPGYQQGTRNGGGSGGTGRGYQQGYQGTVGYQSGGYQSGYQSGYVSGYQQGGYGGYGDNSYRRSGYGGSGGGYRGALWGAGETGGYSGRYTGYRSSVAGSRARGVGAPLSVSSACLSCICNALTGCNSLAGCSGGGCGPFRLSRAYWQDCGAPGGAYEYCTRDYSCSSSCVRTYLTKYAQDCDGDGGIDCRDYARIHRLGGYGCHGPLEEPYRSQVDSCVAH